MKSVKTGLREVMSAIMLSFRQISSAVTSSFMVLKCFSKPALEASVAKIQNASFEKMKYLSPLSIRYLMTPIRSVSRYKAIVRDKSYTIFFSELVAVKRLSEEHKLFQTYRVFPQNCAAKN